MTLKSDDFFTKLGTFEMSPTKKLFGEVCWSGENSYLYVGDDKPLDVDSSLRLITGELHDLTKVTLIDCVVSGNTGSSRNHENAFHHVSYFPHFIVTGNTYLERDCETVNAISFVIEDGNQLFNDFRSFGISRNANILSKLIESEALPYNVPITNENIIAYFSGKRELVNVSTVLGRIVVRHMPTFDVMGGSNGVQINNTVYITIQFTSSVDFNKAIRSILDLIRFFDILIGRPQKLTKVWLEVAGSANPTSLEYLSVYWSFSPGHKRSLIVDERKPNSYDILLDPIRDSKKFESVLQAWLLVNDERRSARVRFSNAFTNANEYTIDRLICAANMFDILPDSAIPTNSSPSSDILKATAECKKIIKSLSNSPERDSILSALGRIGKNNLKQKVRYRAQCITTSALKDYYPDIISVLDEAVACRNYYVHGSQVNIDCNNNNVLDFLTDTLEFVFAISELVEAGWSLRTWQHKSTINHPFARYRKGYADNRLKFIQEIEFYKKSKV
jgi:hypothetical protein